MPSPRTFLASLLVGATLALAAVPCAIAATPSVGVALDTDDDAGTGCTVPTAEGALAGVELVVTARLVTTAGGAYVDRVERQDCAGGTIGGPIVVDSGDWPVGRGAGTGGSAVVELSIPRSLLPREGVAKAVAFASDGDAGADATSPFRFSLVPAPVGSASPVPVPLLPWTAIPLALLVALSAVWLARRHPEHARLAGVLFVFAFAGLAWAATSVVRDGAIGDWSGIAPAVGDPSGDGAANADIVAAFVQVDGANVHLRIDADIRLDGTGPGNVAPTVSAGAGQTITLPSTATLSGSASDDGLPSPPATLGTAWTLDSGPPSGVSFANPAAPATAATFSAPGTYVLRLTANDGALTASSTTTVTVLDGPPQLAAIADRTIELGSRLQIVLVASDGNGGDPLAFSLPTAPAGASLAPPPIVDWKPTTAQLGTHAFTARVTDGSGASASRSFNVTVVHTNHAPTIAPQPDEVVRGGATFVRRIAATDPDEGDTLSFELVTGPPGMTIAGNELRWPTGGVAPGDRTVTVRVHDAAGLADQTSFTLTLLPTAAPIAVDDEYVVRVGETLVVPAAGVLANDENPSGGPMSAVRKSDPSLGTLAAFGADGAFTFEAPATNPAPAFGVAEAWRNDVSGQNVYSFPLVGDVNDDGYPDMLLNHQGGTRAVDGRTGATLWNMSGAGYPDCYIIATTNAPVLADVDDDGKLEYVGALAGCERDSNVNSPGYAPQDRIIALDTTTGLIKWLSPRVSASLGDVLAPGTPPSTEDRFQHVYAGAAFAAPHVARLADGAMPTLLFRKTVVSTVGGYVSVSGSTRTPGCRALTGLPADDGQACRATILMSGVDGAVQQMLIAPNPSNMSQASWDPWRELAPFTVDVDGDGVPEIVSGSDVWKNVGGTWTLLWQSEVEPIQALTADLDGDGRPEIVHVHAMDKTGSGASPRGQYGGDLYQFNGLLILDGATGAEKRRVRLPIYWTSWLTIADIDGDGAPEFVWNTQGRVYAVDTDGRIRWTYAFVPGGLPGSPDAYSGVANAQVYDLDGDGAPEVVTTSRSELVILDGRTGLPRASHPSAGLHGSFYTAQNVQLVDADSDGHVDILATNVSEPTGLAYLMLRGAPNDWLPGPKAHPQVNFMPGDFSGNAHVEFNASVPVSFRNPAQLGTVGDPRNIGTTSFTYAIDHGAGESAPATVTIAIEPSNRPPVITSTAPTGLLQRFNPTPPGGLYTHYYQVTATDPDPGDTLAYSLASAPVWVTMDANGRIRFEPTCGSYGNPCAWGWTFVIVRVTDAFGAFAEQSFLINLTTTGATVPNVVGALLPAANATVAAAQLNPQVLNEIADPSPAGTVLAQDPLPGAANIAQGATVWLDVSTGPQPVPVPFLVGKTLTAANLLLAQLGLTSSVSTVFSVTIPAGEVMAQSPAFGTLVHPATAPPVELTVSAGAPLPLPVASLVVEPGPGPLARLAGETQAFKATAILTDGTSADVTLTATWTTTNATVASVDATGSALAKTAGSAVVTATLAGQSDSTTIDVSTLVPGDNTGPVAAITAPAEGSSVTGPVNVTGTASDANFLRYELAYALAGDDAWTVIGEGTAPVTGGALGAFDPAVLVNDLYTLRLRVFDRGENVTEATSTVQVDGQRKIGLFTLEYRDLNLPAAGIPLTLTRTYDSRDKTKRDFGVGWRLGLDTLRIRTNRVLGTGWVRNVAGPVVSLAPTSEHRVSVTLPDGTVEVFDMRVSPTANIGSLDFTAVTGFEPRPGALGTLEALANPDLLIVNGGAEEELVDDSTLETYQPKVYRYTTVDGTKIEISPTEGVKKVTDRNGNAVTFGPSGILHSDGTGIVFTRDAKGRIVTITDPAGHVQSYAYDGNDDLVAHTDPTGALSRYAYDRRHGLIEVRDALGTSRVRNDYDDTGRLIRMTDAAGNEINYAHDEGANTEIVTDRLGRQTRFVYDTQGNVLRRERGVTIEGVLVNAVAEFAYDGEGNPTSRSDPDGKRVVSSYVDRVPVSVSSDPSGLDLVTAYAYDPHRLLTGAVDPAGRSSSFGYDANGNLVSADLPGAPGLAFVNDASGQPVERRNALGTRAVATRDGSGRVTREEAFDAAATLLARVDYTYDANGNQTTVTRHRTIDGVLTALTTTYGWDAANRMVARTDPAGGTSRFDYDATGRQVAMVDALGRRTTTAYDVLGRMERVTYPDGSFEAWTFDPEGNAVAWIDRAGRTTTYAYDEANRRVLTTLPGGATLRRIYTAAGRVAAAIDALGNRTDYAYDGVGRRTAVTQPDVPDGHAGPLVRPLWTSVHDALGMPVTRTDPYGRVTSFEYDAQARLVRTTYPDGSSVQQGWDALGRRTSVTNEEGQVTTFGYDALGRLVSVAGHAGVATYAYDEAGNRVSQTDALGRTTRFRYDALDRLVERRMPSGATESFVYDAVGNLVARVDGLGRTTIAVHDAMNRLASRTLPGGATTAYAYAPDGQRSTVTDTRGVTTFDYDAAGRLSAVTHPTGEVVGYAYDAADRLVALAAPASTTSYEHDALDRLTRVGVPEGTFDFAWDLVGNRVRQSAPNGVVATTLFDARDRPISIVQRNAGGVLASWTTAYSPSGRRLAITELDGSVETYGYDALGRLVSETRTGTGPRTATHAYDAVGNRVLAVRDGAPTAYAYDLDDRVLTAGAATYAWNANGNLTSRTVGAAVTSYGYDPDDRLVSVTGGGYATQYQLDDDGRRVRASTPSGVTRYLVDGTSPSGVSQVLEERDGGGTLEARYAVGSEVLASTRSGAASVFLGDPLGSVRALADAGGAITDAYRYDAWGESVAAAGGSINPHRYRGERLDGTGLYDLRARAYDPQLGRFPTRDPYAGDSTAPMSLHRYLYAYDDPVNYVDPTGTTGLPELSTVQQITLGLMAAHSAAVFGGELYRTRVFGVALQAGANTLLTELVMYGAGVAMFKLAAPVLNYAGAWMGPAMSKLSGAVGEALGLGGEVVSAVTLREFTQAMRVIAPAYSEIEAFLATKAAGKVLSEASTAAIAKARVAIATAVFQMSPAARKFLRDQVKKFADASVLSTLGAEGAAITIKSSGAWKLFVEILLEIV